jgi:hypothetical protein
MKHLRTFFPLSMVGVLLAGSLFTGCFESDDDNGGGGGNSDLNGIWRMTEIVNGDTLQQVSAELLANGSLNNTYADFIAQQCAGFEGTWSASEDSITTTVNYGAGSESATVAYTLSGTTLTITDESGDVETYTKVTTMLTCNDYGFGMLESWTGSFGALVNGVSMNFGTNVYVELQDGMLGFGGFNGVSNMAFVLDGQAVGSYTEDNAAGTYMPNIADYMNAFVSSELTLELTVSTATHIAGTFSFQGANISAPTETVTVTGQFDLIHE